MEGRPYEELHEFCDFTLGQQNEATAAKGVPPSAPADFQPVVKKSVCYIVAAVLFNENNEVAEDDCNSVGEVLCQIDSVGCDLEVVVEFECEEVITMECPCEVHNICWFKAGQAAIKGVQTAPPPHHSAVMHNHHEVHQMG